MKAIKHLLVVVYFLFFSAFFQPSFAATITPVSGSTTDPIAYSSNIINVIDGIINVDSYLALGSEGYGAWGGPYTVTFDLGTEYNLTSFNLWNNAGTIDNDGEGVKKFNLKFYNNNSDVVGNLFEDVATDVLIEQNFSLGINGIRFIDFIILDPYSIGTRYYVPDPYNNGRDYWVETERQYVLFHEVDFDGSPVPVPSSILLLGLGLLGLAGVNRKKQ